MNLIKFVKRVEEINFEFVKSESGNFVNEILSFSDVKEAIRECKVIWGVHQLKLKN